MNTRIILMALSLGVVSVQAPAYEWSTHVLLGSQSYARSAFGAADSPPDPNHIARRLGFAVGKDADLLGRYFDLDAQGTVIVRYADPFESEVFKSLELTTNLALRQTNLDGWLARGLIREDDVVDDPYNPSNNTPLDEPGGNFQRVFGHFYDPRNNRPLTSAGIGPLGPTAPAWALNPAAVVPVTSVAGITLNPISGYNHFGPTQAREAMWRALTLTTQRPDGTLVPIDTSVPVPNYNGSSTEVLTAEQTRLAWWATVFRSVGDMVHLLQDMAQPQHTRNDAHSGKGCVPVLDWCLGGHASFYESYIDARARNTTSFSVTEGWLTKKNVADDQQVPTQGLTFDTPSPYPTPRFSSYDAYYSSGTGAAVDNGTGLADYSNRGFYSFRTNIGSLAAQLFPSPPPFFPGTGLTAVTQQEYAMDGVTLLPGSVTYITGTVTDPLAGSEQNVKLSAYGAFDQFLRPLQYENYTLIYRNYDDQQRLLVPRAVAYSAGLIDYFFRGRMEISLPDEGVYGIVDHKTPEGADPSALGFDKVKLKLQNTTPGGTDPNGNPLVEQMDVSGSGGATLVAIAKFHRNNCYNAALSGEYGSQNVDGSPINNWAKCRSDTEEIVISNPVTAIPQEINSSAQPITFDFSANKIPINATDLFLQVVYRGKLGAETDAVAVASKDISEPTFLAAYNNLDATTCWDAFWDGISCAAGAYGSFQQIVCQPQSMDYATCTNAYRTNLYMRFTPPPSTFDEDTFVQTGDPAPFAPLIAMRDIAVGTYARIAVLTEAVDFHVDWIGYRARDAFFRSDVHSWSSPNLCGLTACSGVLHPTIKQLVSGQDSLAPTQQYRLTRGIFAPVNADYALDDYGVVSPVPPWGVPDMLAGPSTIGF